MSLVPADGIQQGFPQRRGRGSPGPSPEIFPTPKGLLWREVQFLIGHRYRITKPTVGVRETCKGQVLHTLPLNSIVSVRSVSEEGRSVHVDSAGVSLTLFQRDLVERATRVEAHEISESSSVAARLAIQ